MELDPVRQRILDMVRVKGTSLKTASLAMGRNAAYLHQFLYRGSPRVLSEDDREVLAEHLGRDEDELRHRKRPRRKARRTTTPRPTRGEGAGEPPDGIVAIPEIDVRADPTQGTLKETARAWFFPEPVVRREFRASPSDLRVITIDGDSMEPMVSNGDRIMIDTSQRIPVPPGIFVIWDGIALVAKRIEHEPNSDPPKVVIKSVNPEYETYARDAEEVHIIGRVMWTARRL
jgi:phage repressor protein C with HTH and peptisase S24 domain